MSVLVTKEQLGSALTAADARFLKNVTIKQQATAETGYLATYQLFANTGSGSEAAVGAKINIPKDYLVKSAEVKTVTTADSPVQGYEVGDKYIDFTVNTVDGTGNTSHLYILFKDLLVPYTAGDGIDISSSNVVSIAIDNTSVGGLSVGANGLKLAAATPDTYSGGTKTADGVSGAMTSADKYKLDGIEAGANAYTHPAYTATTGGETANQTPAFGAAFTVSQVVTDATGHVTSQTDRTVTIPNSTATASTSGVGGSAGLMSAADKEALDNADLEAYTNGDGISISNHVVSANVSSGNGLTNSSSGIAMATVSASTSGTGGSNGAMLATDKEKLDGMSIATDSEITTLINSIFV